MLLATFAQNDEAKFPGLANNKQCMAMSVMALMWSSMDDGEFWTMSTLDKILRAGHQMYIDIRKAIVERKWYPDHDGFLAINELAALKGPYKVADHSLNTRFDNLPEFERSSKVNTKNVSTGKHGHTTLEEAINKSLEMTSTALILVGASWFSFYQQGLTKFFFNSHPMGSEGNFSWTGQAGLVISESTDDIAAAIRRSPLLLRIPHHYQGDSQVLKTDITGEQSSFTLSSLPFRGINHRDFTKFVNILVINLLNI